MAGEHELKGIIPIFAVDKKTERGLDVRLIIDATYINKYITVGSFGLPRPNALLSRSHKWFGSIDIANAYLNFPVSDEFAKYQGFQFGGKFYKFTSLMFGVSSAPQFV